MPAYIRHSFRLWRRTPVVTLTIIVTLALAIGANTAAFSVLRAVLLAPLPYPDAGRLAILWTEDPSHDVHQEGVSYPNYADWRRMNHSFADLAFFIRTTYSQVNIAGGDTPERVQSAEVSSNFFDVIGVTPVQGRAFSEDDLKGHTPVVILSAGLAARHLGSTAVIGQSIEIEGRPSTVIGVMTPDFHFPDTNTQVWRPYTDRIPYQPPQRDADYLSVLGRLKPGMSIAAARTDMASIGKLLEQAYPKMPDGFGGFGVNVMPLFEHIYGKSTRPALWLITLVAVCVLLIAITNIANLLLARLEARDHEFAVRAALGAGPGRLARQVLTEIGLLAAIGATLGVVIAEVGLRILIKSFSARLPRLDQASLDFQMLAWAMALTLAACLAAALPPMKQLRGDLFRGSMRTRNSAPLKRAFAISQVALATALLASAGLLLRSYTLVAQTPLGYNPSRLLVFELVSRPTHLGSDQERDAYSARVARETRDRIRALPGVIGVANAGDLFQRRNPDWDIYVEGRDVKPDGSPLADDIVSADFFRVMGAPLLAGRLFTPEEERDPKRVAVEINEAMARKYWPGTTAIGKRFATSPPGAKQNWHTVIGIVGNLRTAGRETSPLPQMYWAIADYPDLKFIVRTATDPNGMVAAIRSEVRSVDAGAVIYNPTTVEAQLDGWISPRRMNTSVAGIFSVLATLLAAMGIFSLLHYATTLRTREFGIRFALGATPSNVLTMVVRDGVGLAAIGAVAGAAGAVLVARAFSILLFGVTPWDAETLVLSVGGVLALAAVASLAPAIRAALLNTAEALRSE